MRLIFIKNQKRKTQKSRGKINAKKKSDDRNFLRRRFSPMSKFESGPVRSMADVDAELALLQM